MSERLFPEINPDSNQVTEVESLCVNCHQNGTTRFLLTRIPHFKDIIISAFECPHCLYRNNEVQNATGLAEKGVKCVLKCTEAKDLNRQVVKAETATIEIPEIQFSMPKNNSTTLTTVEGLLSKAIEDLNSIKENDEVLFERVKPVIAELSSFLNTEKPFTLIIDDPSGNSYLESLVINTADPNLKVTHYERTKEQLEEMGYATEEQEPAPPINPAEEVFSFPANCSSCGSPCETRMHMVDIPYFKEVVIMSTTCDICGAKSNEVKSGGRRIIFKMTDESDLSRDVLKSESCELKIPEIELELRGGTLGGRFTTLEGLLTQIKDELVVRVPFSMGDSVTEERKKIIDNITTKLDEICKGNVPCTIILDDPLANSYLQNLYAPDPDPNITIEEYERSYEQNEDYGLNDMKTENYEQQ